MAKISLASESGIELRLSGNSHLFGHSVEGLPGSARLAAVDRPLFLMMPVPRAHFREPKVRTREGWGPCHWGTGRAPAGSLSVPEPGVSLIYGGTMSEAGPVDVGHFSRTKESAVSTVSHPRKPGPPSESQGQRLWCTQCQTDEYLIIESVDTLRPPRAGQLDVAYTCVECDFFYAHTASVGDVAVVLNRPGQPSGVLQFGGNYLHCGEPMTMAGSRQRSLLATRSTELTREGPLDVYLRTRVLRCSCGFQIEIPD